MQNSGVRVAGISLKNLNKWYGDYHATRDVNLEIAEGELVVLVGPSGCGKSTTLRMIAGLEEISSGEIFIDGQKVNDIAPGKRDIAMVFQNYALYPHMTVRKNLAFGLKMRKTPKAEINRRVNEVAQTLSMEAMLNRKPRELSGGQRQRVALGRAIVRQPKVFLFDEPLSNLDAKLRVQMRTEIAALHQRLQTTIIYVTHDQVEAMTLGQKIVVMDQGVIQQVDSPLEIYNNPANRFVAGFIGSPAMNFFTGKVVKSHFEFGECRVPVGNISNQVAVLGIRPEDIITEAVGPKLAEVGLEVVEHMGHETMVYFQFQGKQHAARLSAQTNARPGDQLTLYLRPQKWHLFSDNDSANRLN